ncbi:MAG: ANTAR domain-containing protein [Actinomycetota bacterium]|nr:ANTAR domain-containing protein [Actinomycetota bacterium]
MRFESEVPSPDAAPASGPLRHITCGGGLTLALHDVGGVLVVGLYGPVGPPAGRGLQSALHAVFTSNPSRILIDASCVTECDRRGLGAFVDAAERARDSGIPFAVSGLARRHVQLLQILWRPDVSAALSYLSLDRALAALSSQPSRHDRTREELLDDVDELQQALIDSRVVEQATGIVMAIYGFTADAAMALLLSHARAQHEEVAVLAGRLIDSLLRGQPDLAPSRHIDSLLDDVAAARESAPGPRPSTVAGEKQAVRPSNTFMIR